MISEDEANGDPRHWGMHGYVKADLFFSDSARGTPMASLVHVSVIGWTNDNYDSGYTNYEEKVIGIPRRWVIVSKHVKLTCCEELEQAEWAAM